jgi:uncharacterized repeat protein (TIGR04042 family)
MPEMTFTTRWPDGRELTSYSPSLVVHEHLAAGATYPVPDFLRRTTTALHTASERVRARYGVPCGRAARSLAEIECLASSQPAGLVEVTAMSTEPA